MNIPCLIYLRRKYFASAGILWFFFCAGVEAQNETYRFDRITTADGLSHNEVRGIWQDREGFIWFVTLDGINRYDGHSFKIYRPEPGRDESTNWVSDIGEDSQGNLWVEYGGLQKYDRKLDKFVLFKRDPNGIKGPRGFISALAVDQDDNVWIGTTDGLEKYDSRQNRFVLIDSTTIQTPPWTMVMIGRDLWLVQYLTGELIRINTQTLTSDVFRFDASTRFPMPQHQIFSILEADSGQIWVFTSRAVIRFDPVTQNLLDIIKSPSGDTISAWYGAKSPDGLVWIGTQHNGIGVLDPHSSRMEEFMPNSSNPHSPTHTSLTNVYADRSGTLWFGSIKGVTKVYRNTNPFRHYEHHTDPVNTLPSGDIVAIIEDSKKNLWFALFGNGVARWDRASNKWTHTGKPKINKWISILFETSQRTVLAGGSGIFEFSESADRLISRYDLPVSRGHVTGIFESADGSKWFSGYTRGIFKWTKDGQWKNYRLDSSDELQTNRIQVLHRDPLGDIWVGSSNMLYRYDSKSDQFIRIKKLRGQTSVIMRKDSAQLWLGTMEGLALYQLDRDTVTYFTGEPKIEGIQIFGFLEDDHQNLWLNTDMGITRFNMQTYAVKNYGSAGEFPRPSIKDNEMAYQAFYRMRDGQMVFGLGASGFVIFHPDSIREDTTQHRLCLTGFSVFGNPISPGEDSPLQTNIVTADKVNLRYDQNSFTFEFAMLDYLNALQNQYIYKLEGFDGNWIQSGKRNIAHYTNIPPGEYVFHVKGSNNDGVWNEEGASIRVIITPPWWKTWWAYSVYGFLFVGLLYGLRRYELNRQKLKHEAELEHVEAAKLRDIDQMKSRFFANISHEFRTPLTLIEGPAKRILTEEGSPKENAGLIVRNTRRLLQLVNQLLDLSKIEAGQFKLHVTHTNLNELVKGIGASFETMARKKNIRFKIEAGDGETFGWVDPDALEKIVSNLVSNAMKFTPENGSVSLRMKTNEREAEITVSDSGIGIEESNVGKVFDRFYQVDDKGTREYEGTGIGLALTKELVELHNGVISLESKINEGSVFRVLIPIAKDRYVADLLSDSVKPSLRHEPIEAIAEPITTEPSSPDEDHPLALVIEDNADMRHYIKLHLNGFYRTEEAVNGLEGFEKALEIIPDLIISDQMMPKMQGTELVQKLKNDPRLSHIPVILLTARADKSDKIEGIKTGADDYLLKPFDAEELKARMDNLIRQRRLLQDKFRREWLTRPKETDAVSSEDKFLSGLMKIVENRFSDPDFDLNSLAESSAMSRVQLHRKLKALSGLAPGEFIRHYRLDRAAQLLKKKAGNVSEIAFDVGFNNLSYFAKAFREKFGVNPSDY